MKLRMPRFRLATLGVLVLLAAVDFSLVRAFFASHSEALLLLMLLIPAMNAAAFGLYRLLDPSKRTACAVGRGFGGLIGVGVLAVVSVVSPNAAVLALGTTLDALYTPIMPLIEPLLNGLAVPGAAFLAGLMLEVIIPAGFLGLIAFLAARIAGWLAVRIRPAGIGSKPLPA